MDLTLLSNAELTSSLDGLCGEERVTTIKILFHLIEFEKRKLFRELGYGNLFDYCTRRLKYSPASAYRRIAAAKCLEDHPELEELLTDGKVTLCSITTAARSIKQQLTKIEDIVGLSQREVKVVVAKSEPVASKAKEVIRAIVVKPADTVIEAKAEERYSMRFSISKETFDRFEEAKAKLSHSIGRELTAEAIVSKLLEHFLKPARVRESSSNGRYVARSVKQEVYRRDEGQCCFVSEDGVQCSQKHFLQFDHVKPFASGGKTNFDNLRLLCPQHNQLMAERHFGVEFMQKHISSEH